MQFFALVASALALAGSALAQPEAARFGIVEINPTTVKPGQVNNANAHRLHNT